MRRIVEKLKKNLFISITFVVGILLRFYFGMGAINMFQHDVLDETGHFAYAEYIFKNLSLPMTNEWQYYQPPFNAIVQAIIMKITSIFTGITDTMELYSYCNVLVIIYSIVTLIFMYKILKLLCQNEFVKKMSFLIVAIYPGFIFLATQYNNDPPALMFFFISLYFAIKWCRKCKMKDIIFLAIFIGIGMLTKISVGLIAFIIGPMMLVILFKNRSKKVFFQLCIFALIVFPLGLSYAIRNLILFDQSFTFVPHVTVPVMQVGKFGIVDRFLSFPITRLFASKFGIYHDIQEYNIWVDLIKTSTYDEVNYSETIYNIPCLILLILNFIFSIVSVLSVIYALITIKKSKRDDLKYISLLIVLVSVVSYVAMNITHPVSCTSSYRYVAYATFAYAYLVSLMISDIIFVVKSRKP